MMLQTNSPHPGILLNKRYKNFWEWFIKRASVFFDVVNTNQNIEENFFDIIAPELSEIKEGYFFQAGMADDETAELILTAEGRVKNIVFTEELVNKAPEIAQWKFTALKPRLDADQIHIEVDGYCFNKENLFFYANDDSRYPDEIDISIIHTDLNGENQKVISNGIMIYLDNYLGELDFVESIDRIKIISEATAERELIPITKLREFLAWRQKEFIERYDGIYYHAGHDTHTLLEAASETGNPMLAIINTRLMHWQDKASHPWIAVMTLKYQADENKGLPTDRDYELLDRIEESAVTQLPDEEGYLYIGREIGDNEQNMYFACRDFRKPSKVLYIVQQNFKAQAPITFDIYKDKYWRSLEHFKTE